MRKIAVFIHGWAMDDRVFHRRWMKDRVAPLFELMKERFGYDILPVSIPGHYLHMDKDFRWYGRFILEELEKQKDADEFLLVGHSMGATTIRTLLKESYGKELDLIKRKIKRVILIGSPNHGTVQPLLDHLSRILTTIGHIVLPEDLTDLSKAKGSYLEETPCYRDLLPSSKFMEDLKDFSEIPIWIKADNIWTLEDTVVEPSHSGIYPGIDNHLIDSLSMTHFNMLYRKELVHKVETIMDGSSKPNGPQYFPDGKGCKTDGKHHWLPEFTLPVKQRKTIWKCKACNKETITHLLPEPLGCSKCIIVDGPHQWARAKRFLSLRFKCSKCKETIWLDDI